MFGWRESEGKSCWGVVGYCQIGGKYIRGKIWEKKSMEDSRIKERIMVEMSISLLHSEERIFIRSSTAHTVVVDDIETLFN